MTPTNYEPSQVKASSLQAEEPTPAPTKQADEPTPAPARTLFLYKPPDARHGYTERIRTCGDACNGNMVTGLTHYLTEPPALVIWHIIRVFEIEEVRDCVKTLKSRTMLILFTLRYRICDCHFVGICALAIYWWARHFLSQPMLLERNCPATVQRTIHGHPDFVISFPARCTQFARPVTSKAHTQRLACSQ
jgi:hypothetical protein